MPGTEQSKSGDTSEAFSFSSILLASISSVTSFLAWFRSLPISGRFSGSSFGSSFIRRLKEPCFPT